MWNARTNQVSTLVNSGLNSPNDVPVDGAGNVYIADAGNNALEELVRAYVPGGLINENAAAGSDALAAVLPTAQPLTGALTPTSDQSWLTIAAVANGVVQFAFTANMGAGDRTAHIGLLGQQITVTQAPRPIPTFNIPGYSVTYDGVGHAATGTAAGVGGVDLSGDLTLTGTTHTNAGTYTDTWTFHDPSGAYQDASGMVDDSIAQASALIVITPYTSASTTYDGTTHTAAGTATGVIGVDLSGGLALSGTTHTNAGTFTDGWIFHDASGNYLDASGTVNDSIGQASATIVVTSYTSASTTYDGNAYAATGTATGIGGVDLSGDLALSGTTHSNAGTFTDGWSFHDAAGNYADQSGTVTDSIGRASAVIVITPYTSASTTFDGNAHTATGTATGVVGLDLSSDLALSDTTHPNAGAYTDAWTFHDPSGNYLDASGMVNDSIALASLSIQATSDSKVYDGSTADTGLPTLQVSGLTANTLFGSDTLTGLSQAFAIKDVLGTGGSTLNVSGYTINDGNGGQNYMVTLLSAPGAITPAPLTISAAANSKIFDGTTSASGAPIITAGTIYGSDTATFTEIYQSAKVGAGLSLTPHGMVSDGNAGADYSYTFIHANNGVITKATPTVAVIDAGGAYTGKAFSAKATVTGVNGKSNASLEGVKPTLSYYSLSDSSNPQLLSGAPTTVGAYEVDALFAGSSDYSSADVDAFFAITQDTPAMTVKDAGGTYNGNPFPATITLKDVTGAAVSGLEGVAPTLLYYSGTYSVDSLPSSGGSTVTPTNAGAYTAVASFAGSLDYAATSALATFTIKQVNTKLTVKDAGGTFNGNPFAARPTLKDVTGTAVSSLEGVSPTLMYYSGIFTLDSLPSSGGSTDAPTNAGAYTVVASFDGSQDYAATSALATFTIKQVNTKLTVKDAGGTYNGNQFAATATLTDATGAAVSNLESVAPTLIYYSGTYTLDSLPNSGGSTAAPTNAGAYTVVASFAGSLDYAATSALANFTIKQAKPVLTVKDSGGTSNGNPFAATVTLKDSNGNTVDSLEGVTPTLIYYFGTYSLGNLPASGGSTLAPTDPGEYTVVAYFAGSVNYMATSALAHFTIK